MSLAGVDTERNTGLHYLTGILFGRPPQDQDDQVHRIRRDLIPLRYHYSPP